MTKTKWKLVYADGSTFSNKDGAWEDAPSDGVQLLMTWEPFWGRRCYQETDHYVISADGEPYGVDGLGAWLRANKKVKFGLMMRTSPYKELIEKHKHLPENK